MGDKTGIEWTDATWNPVRGCSRVSQGCVHCYAEEVAARFSGPGQAYEGLADRARSGSKWTGKVVLVEKALPQPLRWKAPRRIFVNSMSDLFHENLPEPAIDRVFAVMALAKQHTFQVLTKRPERMRSYLTAPSVLTRIADEIEIMRSDSRPVGPLPHLDPGERWWPLRNVWLGTSVEDARVKHRIDELRQVPAAKRFLSCEPLIGDIGSVDLTGIHWVIVGGESGRGNVRPMHPDWARSLRDQCAAAGVAFFFKQWGEWGDTHPDWPRATGKAMANTGELYDPADLAFPDGKRHGEAIRAGADRANLTAMYRVGKKAAGKVLDGRTHLEFPA